MSQSFDRLRRGRPDRFQGVRTCSRQYLSLHCALSYVRRSGAHAEFRTPQITCTRSLGATCPHASVSTCPSMTLATALVGQHRVACHKHNLSPSLQQRPSALPFIDACGMHDGA